MTIKNFTCDQENGLVYGIQRRFQQYSAILWRSVLLVEETGVAGITDKHQENES